MKRGFTLIELLAVLVLVSVLAVISVPSVINYINGQKDEVSDTTKELIKTGASLYIDANNYEKLEGRSYCIQLSEIVNGGFLEEPLYDATTGNAIDPSTYVKATYNQVEGSTNYAFEYEYPGVGCPN